MRLLPNSFVIDGDYYVNCNPHQAPDFGEKHYRHLADTICMNVDFQHTKYNYKHFIINYVFTRPEDLNHLRFSLFEKGYKNVYTFCLWADAMNLDERVMKRNAGDPEGATMMWELNRHREHTQEFAKYIDTMELGEKVDTVGQGKTAEAIAKEILNVKLSPTRVATVGAMSVAREFVGWMINGTKRATTRMDKPKYQGNEWQPGTSSKNHFFFPS
jgi:hypothetical protein